MLKTTANWKVCCTFLPMSQFDYQEVYWRNLPHFHPPGATLFVTFRLAGSIPKPMLRQYKAKKDWLFDQLRRLKKQAQAECSPEIEQHLARLVDFKREWLQKFEDVLHRAEIGPVWLKEEKVAQIVSESLHHLDGDVYRLDAYCIMSNHVHTVFAPFLSEESLREIMTDDGLTFESDHPVLARIMQSLKGYTAYECNRALGRRGQFWQHESYDHVIRVGEFNRIVTYTLNNPIKAGLVKEWEDWPWSYLRSQ
jgi:REP element-mobilizing transposase RayT